MIRREYQDDSDLTEIIIQPDGRIYAFGLSGDVADLLEMFQCGKGPEIVTVANELKAVEETVEGVVRDER